MTDPSCQAMLKKKQEYLRTNIPDKLHEDFGQFCLSIAGNVDIDGWAFEYIEELVTRFKQQMEEEQREMEEENPHEKSYYDYQTANANEARNIAESIRNNNDRILPESHSINFQKPKQTSRQPQFIKPKEKAPQLQFAINQPSPKGKPRPTQKSAVDLLDFAFEDSGASGKSSSNSTPTTTPRNVNPNMNIPQQNKNPTNQQYFKTQTAINNASFFDSVNFWAIPTSDNKKSGNSPSSNLSQKSSTSFGNLDHDPFDDFINSARTEPKTKPQSPSNLNPYVNTSNVTLGDNLNGLLAIDEKPSKPEKQRNSPYLRKAQVDFVEDKPKPKSQIKITEIKNLSQEPSQQQKSPSKVQYKGSTVFKEPFEDSVKCFQSSIRMALSDPDLSVSIQKHEIISRSFFMPDYAMYTLRVLPGDFDCKRNLEDFSKLRSILEKVYPGIHLPYLERNSWLSETNADFIKKQKVMLEFFMADIIYNPELRNSRIFEDFLTFKEHKRIKRKFEEYDKIQKLNGIEDICLLQGKVEVKLKEQQQIYEQKVSHYLGNMEMYLDKQKNLSETLAYQYEQVLATISSLEELMKEISKETKDFNSRVTINEISGLVDAYGMMQRIYKESYIQNKFQLDLLNKKIIPFLHYERQNIEPLKEMIYTRNTLTRRYLKRAEYQDSASTQPYQSEKLKYYKTGVLEESKNMFVFKYQIAFINNQVCNESQRVFELMGHKIAKKWYYVSKKYTDRLSQSNQFWKGMTNDRQS